MNANARMALLLCVLGAMMYLLWKPHIDAGTGLPPMLVSKTAQPAARTVNILFVGDSYDFVNDLPAMLVNIATSDPADTVAVQVRSLTRNGVPLLALWKSGAAEPYLSAARWDYLVLQGQSEWAMVPAGIFSMREAVAKFSQSVAAAGGVTVLYEPWERQPGSEWYRNQKTAFLVDPRYMRQMTHYQTLALASQLKAGVVPVGAVWGALLESKPALALYLQDGSHASVSGTYLAAMVFYRYLVKKDVSTVEFLPKGMEASEAAYIRNFVAAYQGVR